MAQSLPVPRRRRRQAKPAGRRGAYRVIYRIDERTRIVHVLRVDHRADVYHI